MRRRLVTASFALLAALATAVTSCSQEQIEFLERISIAFGGAFDDMYPYRTLTFPLKAWGYKPGNTLTLSTSGLPNGLTLAFGNQSTDHDTLRTDVTLSAGPTVQLGDYPFYIKATSSGGKADSILRNVRVIVPYQLTLNPAATSLYQGRSATAHIDIVRAPGFTNPITFENPGLLNGWNVTYLQNPTSTNALDATITPPANVAVGTQQIGFVGKYNAYSSAQLNYPITLNAATYGVTAAPAIQSIQQGSNATSTVTFDRSAPSAWQGAIDLSYESAQAGITGAFSTSSTTGNSSTLTISVASSVPASSYLTNIRTKAGALPDVLTPVTVNVFDAPRFTFGFTNSSQTVIRGQSLNASFTAMRLGGFGGPITYSSPGATGITVTVTPNPMTGTTGTATFATTTAATVGTIPITITGSGTGVPNATAQMTLQVQQDEFSADMPNQAFTVAGGNSTSPVITIGRAGGYQGPVTPTYVATQPGISGTFNPTPIVGSTSVLTISVLAGTPPGTYQTTANFAGTGGATPRSIPIAVTVPEAVTFAPKFCSLGVDWFAAKDGLAGTYSRILPNIDNSYTVTLNQGLGSIAYSWAAGGRRFVNTEYYTSGEFSQRSSSGCYDADAEGLKTHDAPVTGLTGGTEIFGVLGTSTSLRAFGSSTFNFTNVQGGNVSYIANWRNTGATIPIRLTYRPNVNLTNLTALGSLDINGGESFGAATGTVNVGGLNLGEEFSLRTWLRNSNSISAAYWFDNSSATTSRSYYALPADRLEAGDLQATGARYVWGNTTREVEGYFRTPGMRSYTLPPSQTFPAPTFVNFAPYPISTTNFTLNAAYNYSASIKYEQTVPTARTWSITKSKDFNISASYTLPIENYAAVTGFSLSWAMNPGFSNCLYTATGRNNTGPNKALIEGSEGVNIKVSCTHVF